jgi:hypothetical protein
VFDRTRRSLVICSLSPLLSIVYDVGVPHAYQTNTNSTRVAADVMRRLSMATFSALRATDERDRTCSPSRREGHPLSSCGRIMRRLGVISDVVRKLRVVELSMVLTRGIFLRVASAHLRLVLRSVQFAVAARLLAGELHGELLSTSEEKLVLLFVETVAVRAYQAKLAKDATLWLGVSKELKVRQRYPAPAT